jgi:REP element-mobilizing transposase RayT
MIIAYHIVFTTYGTWLPNDPRGSFSKQIYNQKIANIASIKYVKKSDIPNKGDLSEFWYKTSKIIHRQPYFIDEVSRQIIADSFAQTINGLKLITPACAIMKDHIHILVLRTEYKIDYIVNKLKGTATKNLNLKETPWTKGYWKVFINNKKAMQSAIDYINLNPVSAGMPRQNWKFVKPYDNILEDSCDGLKTLPRVAGSK